MRFAIAQGGGKTGKHHYFDEPNVSFGVGPPGYGGCLAGFDRRHTRFHDCEYEHAFIFGWTIGVLGAMMSEIQSRNARAGGNTISG
jgi:hypothetical protein